MDGGSTDLAVGVEQDGEDVVPGAPGSLALPQQVRGGAVADTRVSRPHLQGQSRASLQDQDIFFIYYHLCQFQLNSVTIGGFFLCFNGRVPTITHTSPLQRSPSLSDRS